MNNDNKNKFVYALQQIGKIKQYEVGIIDNETKDEFQVNFIVENRKISVKKDQLWRFNPLETGDLYPKKICNVCHRLLNTDNFSKNQNGKGNRTIRRPSCDECRKIIDGKNMSKREKDKWNRIKPDMEIFECPICHKRTIAGLTSKVVLDHNHKTGLGRGWICDSCNTGIGRFKDEVELLKSAILFLEKDSLVE
ncbi:MAG: endonuclease VII domain-containing protein [Campylobacteraceae bacterium]|jgi:RNase P subunit RPR2|nr:endonuclease VII domain-containing protein [Campylobacteraceae bacterium]